MNQNAETRYHQRRAWIDSLKVGDEVGIQFGPYVQRTRITSVTRVTKARLEAGGLKFQKDDNSKWPSSERVGAEYGAGSDPRAYLVPVTDDLRAFEDEARLREQLCATLRELNITLRSHTKKLPPDTRDMITKLDAFNEDLKGNKTHGNTDV